MTTTILRGDCRAVLPTLAAGSVHCVVTSPPYFGLRSYLPEGHPDKALEIGLEPTPDEYVAQMVAVFCEVRRVLRDDGTLWLNIGDSYAGSWGAQGKRVTPEQEGCRNSIENHPKMARTGSRARFGDAKPKDLLGIPWMLAFALRADGWHLRSDVIWHKPNPMPESTEDRPTTAHEHVFLLSKRPTYFYDQFAIAEQASGRPSGNTKRRSRLDQGGNPAGGGKPATHVPWEGSGTRNARSVWTIPTQPFAGPHFAVMPPALAEQCILAGTSERGACPACGAPWRRVVKKTRTRDGQELTGAWERPDAQRIGASGVGHWRDVTTTTTTGWKPGCGCPEQPPVRCVVLDPFGGAGTTGLVADRLQRDAVLIELNPDSDDLARDRVSADAPLLAQVK